MIAVIGIIIRATSCQVEYGKQCVPALICDGTAPGMQGIPFAVFANDQRRLRLNVLTGDVHQCGHKAIASKRLRHCKILLQ